ncbi:uncharacterized protein LAESUDRAFT_723952 [Laetiporus sulphureus 93-53]|uniref:F-box domain-containing protein n=1 Tax=Laetiporus sulphureus 93-53 TaxID=1314785 RepID=A0A165F5J1_9APHY|nr:uncharacterized protein LAESUDRAFT_723952 [Laetiporus sulphureus 93-53]KZT08431.1 hypothetical protein LAESUDRAFT_723952 [Laetiporus sulphureus 93-53]
MVKKKTKKTDTTVEGGIVSASAIAAQVSRRNVRGKRGGLKDMPNMPLDVLFEIFCHLHPRDLLNLARTDKSFRSTLMSRNAAPLWKAARLNVEGLPDCPAHLSEPAYANLVFFVHCHNCLKSNIPTILWEFSARLCSGCKRILTVRGLLHDDMDVIRAMKKPIFEVHIRLHDSHRAGLFFLPELEDLKKTWNSLPSAAAKNVFVEERVAWVAQRRQFGQVCRAWAEKRAESRSNELQQIKRNRVETIVSKLRALGWGDELDRMLGPAYFPLSLHVHVRPAKRLTETAWRKISADMIQYMQEIKRNRLESERKYILQQRFRALCSIISDFYAEPPGMPEYECKPSIADFAMMPAFREIIDSTNDTVIDATTFLPLRDQLPMLIEQWQADVKEQLRRIVQTRAHGDIAIDPLDLATTVFECTGCTRTLQYPNIIKHSCLRSNTLYCYIDAEFSTVYEKALYNGITNECAWSTDGLRVSDAMSHFKRIVTLCGKDPISTTQQEMDALDVMLYRPIDLAEPHGPQRAYTWRAAIMDWHVLPCINNIPWTVVSHAQLKRIRESGSLDSSHDHIKFL